MAVKETVDVGKVPKRPFELRVVGSKGLTRDRHSLFKQRHGLLDSTQFAQCHPHIV